MVDMILSLQMPNQVWRRHLSGEYKNMIRKVMAVLGLTALFAAPAGAGKEIDGIGVQIENAGNIVLMVFLSADGNVKRIGSGHLSNTDKDLYIGQTKESWFSKVRALINEDVVAFIGKTLDMPNPTGPLCKLTISYKMGNQVQQTIVTYGQESGLPYEFHEITRTMHKLTEPWYQAMLKTASGPARTP